jgi:Ca2+-binding RTX toxin-like protein
MSRARRRPALPRLEELRPRINPVVTATFSSGLLTVVGDTAPNNLVLLSDLSGNILLQEDGGPATPITGGPTLGNTNAIIMQGDDGADVLDVSQLPGTNRTIVLDGGAGDDLLIGGQAADSMVGGVGNDTLQGFQGDDRLFGGAGDDVLDGGVGDDVLVGEAGADTFTGGAGDDLFDGSTNADTAVDIVSETIDANVVVTDGVMVGAGADTLQGIEGVAITGGVGNNLLDASGRTAPVSLFGGAGNDTLIGSGADDTLDGQSGNDSLLGLGGNDALFGGDGNDTARGGDGNDSLTGGIGNDSLLGDAGTDRLVEDPTTTPGAVGNNLTLSNTSLTGALGSDRLTSVEQAQLTASAGTAGNFFNASSFTGPVTLDGGLGNDSLLGGSGSDVLTGGPGTNRLNGGTAGTDTVVETGNLNFTLRNSRLDGLGAVGLTDFLAGVERANLTGGPGNNVLSAALFTLGPVTLTGGAGNDTLTGTAFADQLTGGIGDDSIGGGNGNDLLVETLDTSLTLTNSGLTGGLGNDTLSSIERASLTGGATNNDFDATAFTGPVTLIGGDGNDSLHGGSANDLLTGGVGDDQLFGGDGIDTLTETADTDFTLTNSALVSSATGADFIDRVERVQLTGGAGDNTFTVSGATSFAATLTGGAGTDRVVSADDANFTLTNTSLIRSTAGTFTLNGIEEASLTGGAGDNTFTVTGWTGSATLAGGGGADLVVAAGNADYFLTDTSLTNSTGATFALSGIEQARLSGGTSNNFLDASGFTGRVTLNGGDGADTLIGGSGDDSLFGGTGPDFLDGRGGIDTLNGGNGTDIGTNGEEIIDIP